MRLGAGRPTRCTAHKVPDMVKSAKEVVPVATKPASQAVRRMMILWQCFVQNMPNTSLVCISQRDLCSTIRTKIVVYLISKNSSVCGVFKLVV